MWYNTIGWRGGPAGRKKRILQPPEGRTGGKYERYRLSGEGSPSIPHDQAGVQASAAGVRQTADLLPHRHTHAGGHLGHYDYCAPWRDGHLPGPPGAGGAVRPEDFLCRAAGGPGHCRRPSHRPAVCRGRPGVPGPGGQHLLRAHPGRHPEAGGRQRPGGHRIRLLGGGPPSLRRGGVRQGRPGHLH